MHQEYELITEDPSFAYRLGTVRKQDMRSPNNGLSLEFDLEDKGLYFKTDVTKKWYPDDKFEFTPTQFHFHHGKDGAEHTLSGVHYDVELHLVSLNHNPDTKDKFLGAVTGIIFKVDNF